MPVTLKDVAREAGVSASTVSRALSRPDVVDAVTRARVLAAANALGYRPNRAARMLNTGRTDCLGVVLPDLENPFFAGVLKGIELAGARHGLQILIADSAEDPAAEARAIDAFDGRVDGLVLCSSRLDDAALGQVAASRRVVLINRAVAGIASVSYDNAGAMEQAVTHLASLGHRRIAYVDSPHQSRSARQRRDGFLTAARKLGVADAVVLDEYAPSFAGGGQAAPQLLASRATGVVVYNDVMAIGLLNQLLDLGVRIPEQISMIGVDDIPLSRMVHPPLTTVHLPRRQAGERAVDLLVDLVDDDDAPPAELLATALVVRASTAVPPPQSPAS